MLELLKYLDIIRRALEKDAVIVIRRREIRITTEKDLDQVLKEITGK